MGTNISSHINGMLIQYLKTLKTGSELYSLKKYEHEFVGVNLPKVKIMVKDFFIISLEDFVFDESADMMESSVNVKSPLIIFKIGDAAVESAELGFEIRVSGKIEIRDVQLKTVLIPSFENGLRIAECDPTVKVKKIKFDLHLTVNGRDHSHTLNLLLTAVSPEIVSMLLNAVLQAQKENMKNYINKLLESL